MQVVQHDVARYFPVRGALRMRAGLMPFGCDLGNGAADQRFFQRDAERSSYLKQKAEVLARAPDRWSEQQDPEARAGVRAALGWLRDAIGRDTGIELPADADLDACARAVQEDVVVVQRDTRREDDRLSALHVCFPSGWRPERLLGVNFEQVHGPVPGFASAQQSRSLVTAMIERGPYLRFVWTLCRGQRLDRHPDLATCGWEQPPMFRVERQITVPLREHGAALFLIRVYHRPLAQLDEAQREQLVAALRASDDAVLRYKGLWSDRDRWIATLRSGPNGSPDARA